MIRHSEITDEYLRREIKALHLQFGGNAQMKIYGTLDCKSGKRMKRENRIFFTSENEAMKRGYRPCGNCMKDKAKEWISLTT